MRLIPVEPVGTRKARVMVHGEVRVYDEPVYPTSPQGAALWAARKAASIGLRDAAARLGMSATELSLVETGAAAFVDADEFERALARLTP